MCQFNCGTNREGDIVSKYADMWSRWLGNKHNEDVVEKKTPLLGKDSGRNLALLALLGVFLLVISSKGGEKPVAGRVQEPTVATSRTDKDEQDIIATKLAQLLSEIAGAGRVRVYITLDNGPHQVLAEEITMERVNDDERGGLKSMRTTQRPIIIRDDTSRAEQPVVLTEYKPKVRGVVVVATGATDLRVRQQLTRAVETALGVAAHRVSVFAGNI